MRISTKIIILATLLFETSANSIDEGNSSLAVSHVECNQAFPIPNMCGLTVADCTGGCTCNQNGVISRCTPPTGGCTSSQVVQQ